MKRRDTLAVLGFGAASWLTGCGGSSGSAAADSSGIGGAQTTTTAAQDIVANAVLTVAQADPNLSILAEVVVSAGLGDIIKPGGPFTLFAPVNAAFTALLAELGLTKAQLLADKPLLTQVLTYHLLAVKVMRAGIPSGKAITTVQGGIIKIDIAGVVATITDGRNRTGTILKPDLLAGAGVVHTVDRVLLPANKTLWQTVQTRPDFSILAEALTAANMQNELTEPALKTLFAPTNAAFAQLLTQINFSKEALLASGPLLADVLHYHLLTGRWLKADLPIDTPIVTQEGSAFRVSHDLVITDELLRPSLITATDVLATNGVMHVVDHVLLHILITT